MAYITNADIEQRLGTAICVQLTDDAGLGVVDTARMDEARLAAEAEANSYLARRASIPLDLSVHADVAPVVRGVVIDLAAYRLHLRRPPVPPDVVRRRHEALQWLERVARGEVALASCGGGLVAGPQRTLSRDALNDI